MDRGKLAVRFLVVGILVTGILWPIVVFKLVQWLVQWLSGLN